MTRAAGRCYNRAQGRRSAAYPNNMVERSAVAKTLDLEQLRASADARRFQAFERELEQAVEYEWEERRRKIEDTKRAKEKRARKKRLKAQAALRS